MPISPTSFNNITVGYITETEGYIHDVSLADANTYAIPTPAKFLYGELFGVVLGCISE